MNFFIEGLQGSGKSTMVQRLSEHCGEYTPVMEGEYSPVELAWCAYVDEETYGGILRRYAAIHPQIEEKTVAEGDRRIICFTKIRTDIPGFYKDMERYEIYNGRIPFEAFKSIVLTRYRNWRGDGRIYECALFQNIVEDMILFRQASDEEIMEFYRQVYDALEGREYRVVYLETEDIRASIDAVRKERLDEQGNERWFSTVREYFNASPYAMRHGLRDEEGFVTHLRHRQALELRLCREIFPEKAVVLKSKKTDAFFGAGAWAKTKEK